MSKPTQAKFAIVEYSDMAVIPVFTALCGVVNVSISEAVETSSQRVRDCASPNLPGTAIISVLGTSWNISAAGLPNTVEIATIKSSLLGKKVDYRLKLYDNDPSAAGFTAAAGALRGTYTGLAIMNAFNQTFDQDGDSSRDHTWEGEGALTWVVAP